MEKYQKPIKGRGAQINPSNPYLKHAYDTAAEDGLDEALVPDTKTELFFEHPKKILNHVKSPDVPFEWSLNPYQGCEHGCIYCYARNAHTYWGFSAGLDFERKIIVKENAAELLVKALENKRWQPKPIMLSGNTDCYQPLERKLKITRQCLEVLLRYHHPLSLITKNSLILRDLDLLKELAKEGLVHVAITITTLNEELRRAMEPRTASTKKRLAVVETLAKAGIPVGVMLGPVIPGLNNHEIPKLVEESAKRGALSAGYTFVRLNGQTGDIFEHWIKQHFPDRAQKVLSQIKASHAGSLNDSTYGRRMRGEGEIAKSVAQLYKIAKRRFLADRKMPPYNLKAFRRPSDVQLRLFE
ncbi:MAG: PA0069 family radical SAM protein [Bacteroidota bacterium]